MKYGICIVSVAPVRAEADDRSEMVTQLLFGEMVEVLKITSSWLRIKNKYDGYEGWMDPKMICAISEEVFIKNETLNYTVDLFNLMLIEDKPLTLTIGAHLANTDKDLASILSKPIEYLGDSIDGAHNDLSIVEIAEMFINTPYLWGGKSSFGIDCSGLVQQVYKFKNVKLPRDASQQAELGEVLSFIEEAQPGDLAFFDNEEGIIIHVGIMIDNYKIIHAHGQVRIDPIDSTGIFNTDKQQYSHKLRFLRRIDA